MEPTPTVAIWVIPEVTGMSSIRRQVLFTYRTSRAYVRFVATVNPWVKPENITKSFVLTNKPCGSPTLSGYVALKLLQVSSKNYVFEESKET